jgi:hypothetical protein
MGKFPFVFSSKVKKNKNKDAYLNEIAIQQYKPQHLKKIF